MPMPRGKEAGVHHTCAPLVLINKADYMYDVDIRPSSQTSCCWPSVRRPLRHGQGRFVAEMRQIPWSSPCKALDCNDGIQTRIVCR